MSLLIEAIEKIAPSLSTAMLGPIGGILTSLIEKTFGLSGDALAASISTDPDASVKLKQIEMEHATLLAHYNSDEYTKTVASIEDARKEAIAGNYEWVVHLLAFTITVGFFALIFFICTKAPDQSDHDIFNMMIGSIAATWVGSMQYYFGNIKK